jgi:hypothetical protein
MLLTQLLTNFIDISVGNFAEVLAGSSMMLEQRSLPTASQNDTGMKTIPDQSAFLPSKGSGQAASPKNAAEEGSSNEDSLLGQKHATWTPSWFKYD